LNFVQILKSKLNEKKKKKNLKRAEPIAGIDCAGLSGDDRPLRLRRPIGAPSVDWVQNDAPFPQIFQG
jgi:hypothetical protein